MRTTKIIFITSLFLVLVGMGCSDDTNSGQDSGVDGHGHHDAGVNLNEEGCEHMKKGPFVNITAGTDTKTATEVKADYKAYQVKLTAGTDNYVKFAAGAKGHILLFFDANVTLEVQDDQGQKVSLHKSETSIKECTEVKAKHVFEAAAVGTFYFKLTPGASTTQVTIVIEEEGHTHTH